MKLTVNFVDGRTIIYEGSYEEVVRVGEQYVALFGDVLATPSDVAQIQPRHISTVRLGNGSRRWTEQSARRLWGLLYGEQAKAVKFIVQHRGRVKYADLSEYLGYKAQKLSGVLSSITRNSQSATGDPLARLVDWRMPEDGIREYYVDPEALPLLTEVIQHEP